MMTTALYAGLAAVLAVALGSWLRFWWLDRALGLPGPAPFPIVGNLPALGKLPHRSIRELGLKYRQGLFRMHLGSSCAVILSREQSVREMHRQGAIFYARPNYEIARIFNLEGHGFSFTAGEQWAKVRRLANDLLLSRARSLDMVPQIEAEADDLVRRLHATAESGRCCEIKLELQSATANLYMKIAWNRQSRQSDRDRDLQLVTDLDLIFFNVGKPNPRDYFPFLKRLPSKRVNAVRAARARVRVAMEEIIAEHRRSFDPAHPRDMIDVLLTSDEAAKLSELDLQQMVAEMFIGAVVPGAMPIAWAVLLLANKPELQAKVHSELAAACNRGSVSLEVLERQPLFQAFLLELLRLYGASPLIPRRSIEETSLAGFVIPPNTEILVNYYGLHTDPEIWVEPFAFRPERFLACSSGPSQASSKSYMPFGKGGRNCPGKPLAEFELELFLSRLILNFEFAPPDSLKEVPLDETIGLALCPVQSRVRLLPRGALEESARCDTSLLAEHA